MSPDSLILSALITIGILFFASAGAVCIYRIPIRISANGSIRNGGSMIDAGISWGCCSLRLSPDAAGWQGIVSIGSVTLFREPLSQTSPSEQPPDQEQTGHDVSESDETQWLDLLRYLPLVMHVIQVFISHFRIGKLTSDIRFGAGDPVTTGIVYGYYHAIRPLITGKTCSFTVVPDFESLTIEGEASVEFLVTRPLGLVLRVAARIIPVMLPEIRSSLRRSGRTANV